MRLRHIEVFHAIYTTGSITSAAKSLLVSQPSVSKVLAHAEMQLGFLLFERVKGRLIPTSEAELLFEEVDRVFQQMKTIKTAAENIRNNEIGRIALATTPALGFDIIPEAIAKFRQSFPQVRFNISSIHNDQVKTHLLQHDCELAVMLAPEKSSGLKQVSFGYAKVKAVYHHAMFPHLPKTLSLDDIAKHPLIDIQGSGPVADLIWQAFNERNIRPKSDIKVQTYFIAVHLVQKGMGLCLVDEFTANSQSNDEVIVADLREELRFPIKGLYLENVPLSRATNDFIDNLKTALSALSP